MSTQAVEAATTTTSAATTTTLAAFDLGSLDEATLRFVNWNCSWAKDLTNPNTGAPYSLSDTLQLEIQSGFAPQRFLDATATIDVENEGELKLAIAQACDEIGAPTDGFPA